MQKTEKERLGKMILCGIVIGISVILFFRYVFAAVLPFLIAFIAAMLLHRPARNIAKRLKWKYQVVAVGLTALVVSLGLFLMGFLIFQTVSELVRFAKASLSGENSLLEGMVALLQDIGEKISHLPFFSGEDAQTLREKIVDTVSDLMKDSLMALASRLPALAAKWIGAVPQIFIFFAVTVLSAVYACADYEKLTGTAKKYIPGKWFGWGQKMLFSLGKTALTFARSYLLLFIFTFAALLLGFSLLKEPYAFLFALLTTLVDSLPIIGMGTVLFPLTIYHFMIGNTVYGVGIVVIYLLLSLSRQMLEPRLLGAGMGIHPLLMLMAMYTGFRLFGVWGMVIAPFSIAIIKNLIGVRQKQNEETV